jgi:queuine tRNA-ribosyltransferase
MFFEVKATSGRARAGIIHTEHGDIPTPIFMPVGTRGTIKSMMPSDLEDLDAAIILGNTYHLYLRPGHELIECHFGGLHEFATWKRPILTDSGGYQVFSLAHMRKVKEEGVTFRSHIDGSLHLLSPEKSMEIQRALGSDIVMCFDECPALPATKETLETSMQLTLRWAKRCREFELKPHQHLFGIIQGGLHQDLRLECLERLKEMNFSGYALGGLSVGEKNSEMREFLWNFVEKMPAASPRYLMGVGKPLDILNAVKSGMDMFDCVLPTRNARNGGVFTTRGPINIKNEKYRTDPRPMDENCTCKICKRYSRSFIRHLFNVGEMTAGIMMTYHNIHFYLTMMREMRESIVQGTFEEYHEKFYSDYQSTQS